MKEKYSSLSTLFSTHSTFFNFINKVSNKPYKIFYTGLIPKPIRQWLAKKSGFISTKSCGYLLERGYFSLYGW